KVLDDYDAAVWVQPDDETMKKISGLKNKVIVTNRYPDDLNFVSTNHRQAINEVTKHYITNCDKKSQIFFLSHDDQSFVMRQRKEGFIKACSEFQRFYRICEAGYSYDEILSSLLDLPLDTKKPIIMISPSCNLTGAVLSMAKERGLEINKNLFYADFDNIMSLQLSGVRISTVLQNYAEMGRVVMDSIKLLGKKPVQVFVPYKIIGLETE
ncbi:MAG: LacI family DNA-binding transcriptional regulator, partial [Candidatus Omnitrophica bacterium]|nr:LacI family DNA-binding transcriptional regulator [Candidatus Omnitrophota bacterium]